MRIAPSHERRGRDSFEAVLFGSEQAVNIGNGFGTSGLTREALEAFSGISDDDSLPTAASRSGIQKSNLLQRFKNFVERMVKFSTALQEFAKKLFPALTVDQNGNVNSDGSAESGIPSC